MLVWKGPENKLGKNVSKISVFQGSKYEDSVRMPGYI